MNGKTHAYLDLAALPPVGALLFDPRPAMIFRGDGSAILWANAAALAVFGEPDLGALLNRRFDRTSPLATPRPPRQGMPSTTTGWNCPLHLRRDPVRAPAARRKSTSAAAFCAVLAVALPRATQSPRPGPNVSPTPLPGRSLPRCSPRR
jgi:hypothetical protein